MSSVAYTCRSLTASGAPCRAPVVTGTDMCASHTRNGVKNVVVTNNKVLIRSNTKTSRTRK